MADKKQQQILAELAQAFAGDTGQEIASAAKPAEEGISHSHPIDSTHYFKHTLPFMS
jgi:hypothetical protein